MLLPVISQAETPQTMLVILLLFLALLLPSLAGPICQDPPPEPTFIPNLDDCINLLSDIMTISRQQHDAPIVWSRGPSGFDRKRLPYSFADPLSSNDCEFIVEALYDDSQDTFPTRLIAEAAEAIVQKCMIDGTETLGAVTVGPKRVVAVFLTKRWWERGGRDGRLGLLNVTNARLLRPGSHTWLNPALLIKEG